MPTADSVKTKLQGLIATANETTGGNDTTLTAAVNTLVGGYGQGGSTPSSWSRPWDWPNYDTMERPTSDVIYHTFDCRYGGYAEFDLFKGGIVSIGQINNGVFEAVETETLTGGAIDRHYAKQLTPEMGDYIVIRVLPLEGSTIQETLTRRVTQKSIELLSCVEIWGRAKDAKIMHCWVNNEGGIMPQTRAVTLFDFDFRGVMGSFNVYAKSLEYININDWGLPGDITSFNTCFRTTRLNSLTIPKTWDTSKITNWGAFIRESIFLTHFDMSGLDTQAVTSLANMFTSCYSLTTVDMSGCDFRNVTNTTQMFYQCTALVNLYIDVIPVSISFNESTLLSHESLLRILNALTEVTTTQTLTLGAKNLAKLTDEEKAIATEKGWTLA